MDKKTREILSKPVTEHKKPGAGGRQFSYIKGDDVIGRLNTAFGNDWSSTVKETWVTDDAPKQVMVLVELSALGVVHQGFGGAEIAVYTGGPKQGTPVDISNSYKGALTNAIKNAAKYFGVGLITDEVSEAGEGDTTTHSAPPAPSTASNKPVSASTTITPQRPAEAPSGPAAPSPLEGVDLGALQKTLEAAANKASPSTEPEVSNKPSLAENYMSSSEPPKTQTSESPFPANNDVDTATKINDIQLSALKALTKSKNLTPDKAISMSLDESSKTEYENLTKEEARVVIKTLNTVSQ